MNRFKDFLHGIYGIDGLSCGLLLLSVILNLITAFLPGVMSQRWNLLSFLPLLLCILRALSHNHQKRDRENQIFLKLLSPFLAGMERRSDEREEARMFKFFKCPACGQKIRVPKGKGKVEITCPKCGDKFIKKT